MKLGLYRVKQLKQWFPFLDFNIFGNMYTIYIFRLLDNTPSPFWIGDICFTKRYCCISLNSFAGQFGYYKFKNNEFYKLAQILYDRCEKAKIKFTDIIYDEPSIWEETD